MHIFILVHNLNNGGVANAAIALADSLVQENYKVTIIVIGEESPAANSLAGNIDILYLGAKRTNKISYIISSIFKLKDFLTKHDVQNLIIWGKEFSCISIILKFIFRLNIKIVAINVTSISNHLKYGKSKIEAFILKILYKSLLNKADHIIAQSQGMVSDLINNFNIKNNDITVAYPLISNKYFNNEIASGEKEILFIGKLSGSKKVDKLIRAFAKLPDKANMKLRIIGEGPLEGELKSLSRKLNINDNIIFEGAKTNILPYLQNAHLLALTSKYEGFGMVLVEAIASGLPVVSTDCPVGPSEIVEDNINGFLVPYDRDDLLVDKINQALNINWDRERIKQTAEKFRPENILQNYLTAIKRCFNV